MNSIVQEVFGIENLPPDFGNVPARVRRVENTMEEISMPPPERLIQEAENAAVKPRFFCATDYAEAVRIMRDEKGYQWLEVGEWFAARGVDISWPTLRAAYYRLQLFERQSAS